MPFVRFSRKYKSVPLGDMKEVIVFETEQHKIALGTLVRLKRTLYQNDLAQVIRLSENDRLFVRLVPRLSEEEIKFYSSEESNSFAGSKRKIEKKNSGRPPAKIFTPNLPTDKHPYLPINVQKIGRDYFHKGFIIKEIAIAALKTTNVNPKKSELDPFLKNLFKKNQQYNQIALSTYQSCSFAVGDRVAITSGEQQGLEGTIKEIAAQSISVYIDTLNMSVSFHPTTMKKIFRVGDHIKVFEGEFKGDAGVVTAISDATATILSDSTFAEYVVEIPQIHISDQKPDTLVHLGSFRLHDLVSLTTLQSVAIIAKVEKDGFRVVDLSSQLKYVKLAEVANRVNNSNFTALDRHRNPIREKDTVTVCDGPHKDKEATVKHVYRSVLFVYSTLIHSNFGIAAIRSNCCVLYGSTSSSSSSSSSPSSSSSASYGGFGGHFGRNDNRNSGSAIHSGYRRFSGDKLSTGATTTIPKGPWKGYSGRIVACSFENIRIQLQSKSKEVNVPRKFWDDVSGSSGGSGSNNNSNNNDFNQRYHPTGHESISTPSFHHSTTPFSPNNYISPAPEFAGTPLSPGIPQTPRFDMMGAPFSSHSSHGPYFSNRG